MSYLATPETPVLRIAGRESWDVQGSCQRRGLFSCSSYSSSCRVHPGYEDLWCHPGFHVSVVLDWQGFNVLEASRVDCFTNDQYGKFISTVHVWACHISQSLFIYLAAMTVNIFKCFVLQQCGKISLFRQRWKCLEGGSAGEAVIAFLAMQSFYWIGCQLIFFRRKLSWMKSLAGIWNFKPTTKSFESGHVKFLDKLLCFCLTSIGPGMGMFWSVAPLNNFKVAVSVYGTCINISLKR